MPDAPPLASLPSLADSGTPAALRVILPPNLAAAAPRDAIAVRFEIHATGQPAFAPGSAPRGLPLAVPPAHLAALFLVESWNRGTPTAFAQLSRVQLAALLAVLRGEPAFAFAPRPRETLAWAGDRLPGVSDFLAQPPAAPAPAPTRAPAPRPAAPPRSTTTAAARPATSASGTPALVDGSEHFLAIQLPSREHFSYQPVLELIQGEGFRLETSNRKWWQRDRHRALAFIARQRARLEHEFGAVFTENFSRNTAHLAFAEVDCAVAPARDGFEVEISIRAGDATDREINDALQTGRPFVESGGRIFLLDQARLARARTAQQSLAGSPAAPLLGRSRHRVAPRAVAEVDALLATLSPNLQAPEEWIRRSEILRNPGALAPAPAPAALIARLRPYQALGAAWMWHLYRHGLGGILADEMGLGKTVQAITLLAATRAAAPRHITSDTPPALVVAPATLLENWRRELARFAPHLRVLVHHGATRADDDTPFRAQDVVVTSYGTLTRDETLFHAAAWHTLIADEAQHVKNRRTRNAQALQGIRASGRLLLTGTPVENSLGDLVSLFAVILPGYLKPAPDDARGEDRAWHDARIRRQAAPYILRRTKTQVAPELPPKIEQTVFVDMTDRQRALYESVRLSTENELMRLEAAGQSESRIRVALFTQLLRLRQICGDPRLLDRTATPEDSAKLAALVELLEEAADGGHRVLVFSQFTSLLALVREEMDTRAIPFCYLDGAMPQRARQAEVDRFNTTPEVPLFLLSLKAGGTGLNLATADTVVHLDPWWNPAVEAQATDRAHRIGQTRLVTSYKLIAAGSVEERVLALQDEKKKLLAGVFDEAEAASAALTVDDLKALLAR